MWAVSGGSSFINISNRSQITLRRVIRDNLAWHTGCVFQERMPLEMWEANVSAVGISSTSLASLSHSISDWFSG